MAGGARIRLRPVGPNALLADVADSATALQVAHHVRAHRRPLAGEIVPGASTVLFDDVLDRAALDDVLTHWRPDASHADAGPLVELPTDYDGPDLADVAGFWGTDVDGVVARHAAIEFVAAFCGFAPGFAYLSGLDAVGLAVPRLETPRTRVPAGSVALAGGWCGVYPRASPGGWRLIGRTDAALWDVGRIAVGEQPALVAPGTRVRFVPR